jgi:Uma2 family endonuclease
VQQDIQLTRRLFSIEDYYKMAESGILEEGARVELINGEIISMSPINSKHSGLTNLITRELFTNLGNQASICVQNPIRLNEYSEPEPDIVIAEYKKDAYSTAHPTPKDIFFVIEVSDSSLDFDRKIKASLYAEANVPEYWIVNIPEQQVEIYTHPGGGEYLNRYIAKKGDTAKSSSIHFEIAVSTLFE